MQTHLVSNKLNSSEAKFLFKIRTCMLGVKTNFKEKFKNNLSCQVCLSHTEEGILTSSAPNTENKTTKYMDMISIFLSTNFCPCPQIVSSIVEKKGNTTLKQN